MGSRKTSLARRLDLDAERVGAGLILAELTKGVEAGFEKVMIPEPISTVSVDTLRLAVPGGRGPDDTAINASIPFVVISSDNSSEGRGGILHPAPTDAIAAWSANLAAYLAVHPKCRALFWRVKPEIDYDSFFDTRKRGWKVYSRLAVY